MTIIGREEISKFTKICAILKENRANHAGPGTYLFHYMIIRILSAEKIKTQDMSLSSMMTLGPPMLSEVKPNYFTKQHSSSSFLLRPEVDQRALNSLVLSE